MVYLVTYDLNTPGQGYQRLYDVLNQYDSIRDEGLDSVWFINTQKSVQQLTDDILRVIDKNDNLFVTKLNRSEYQGWMKKSVWDWIRIRV